MANKTSRKSVNSKTKHQSGKKGGMGVLTPETVGAMAGAAIGGVAGMMLGNRHHKSKIATVKESATVATKNALNVLESEAKNLQGEAENLTGKSAGKKNSGKKK